MYIQLRNWNEYIYDYTVWIYCVHEIMNAALPHYRSLSRFHEIFCPTFSGWKSFQAMPYTPSTPHGCIHTRINFILRITTSYLFCIVKFHVLGHAFESTWPEFIAAVDINQGEELFQLCFWIPAFGFQILHQLSTDFTMQLSGILRLQ